MCRENEISVLKRYVYSLIWGSTSPVAKQGIELNSINAQMEKKM